MWFGKENPDLDAPKLHALYKSDMGETNVVMDHLNKYNYIAIHFN